MSTKVRVRLLILIATVWAINSVILPVIIKDYTPDPMINGVFTLVAGAIYAQQPTNGSSKATRPSSHKKIRREDDDR